MACRVPCAATASVAANDEGRREDSRSSGGIGVPVNAEDEAGGGEAEEEEEGRGPWMGPGARGEGAGGAGEDDDDEEALLVVAVSAKLRNRLPCSRGPRGTSISPRDLPSCVTDAAERGRHACEEVGESTSRTGTRTTRALTPAARVDATRRRGRCWLEGVIFERKLGALKPPL